MHDTPAGRNGGSRPSADEPTASSYVCVAAARRTSNSCVTACPGKPQAAARVIHCVHCSPPSRATWTGGDYSCRRPR